MKELIDNADWIAKQYETKSIQEIADSLGVSRNTVRNRMIKFGIARRDRLEIFVEYVKNPKSIEHRRKMSQAAKQRWKESPITDDLRMRMSEGRRKNGKLSSPYKWLFDVEHGYIAEHRLIMIKHLGRPLLPNEHVHHIDGNPQNNDISNLIVLLNRDHARLHNERRERDELGRFTK